MIYNLEPLTLGFNWLIYLLHKLRNDPNFEKMSGFKERMLFNKVIC